MIRQLAVLCVLILGGAFALISCDGSSSSSSSDTGTSADLITSVENALITNPDGNPVTLDSSNSNSSASKLAKQYVNFAFEGFSLDLRLQKEAGTGDSFGAIQGWQCNGDDHEAYFTLAVTNNSDNTAAYTGTFKLRDDTDNWGNSDIIKSVSTDGTGSITVHTGSNSLTVAFVGGTINTLAASNGYVFAWNSDGLACGQMSDGSQVPFTFDIDDSTKEKKSPSSSSDDSLCSSLPTAPTYNEPQSFSGDENWDCQAPAGSTEVSVESAPSLEDKGGDDCTAADNFFASASVDLTSCGSSESPTDMLCFLRTLYAIATQAEKSIKRSLECKFEGVAQMASDGDIDFNIDSGKEAEGQIHILDMGFGS